MLRGSGEGTDSVQSILGAKLNVTAVLDCCEVAPMRGSAPGHELLLSCRCRASPAGRGRRAGPSLHRDVCRAGIRMHRHVRQHLGPLHKRWRAGGTQARQVRRREAKETTSRASSLGAFTREDTRCHAGRGPPAPGQLEHPDETCLRLEVRRHVCVHVFEHGRQRRLWHTLCPLQSLDHLPARGGAHARGSTAGGQRRLALQAGSAGWLCRPDALQ